MHGIVYATRRAGRNLVASYACRNPQKKYSSMIFAAIDPNFFFVIDNYASYDKRPFLS